jgi:hypothetical protein
LFDTQKDPQEMRSVLEDSNYASVRKDLELELTKLRKDLGVPEEVTPESMGGKSPKGKGLR